MSELFHEVAIVLRREEKLAVGHLAAVPDAGAARLTPAPASESGTAQLRAVPTFAA
jgi:hypothetical protein